MIELNDQFLYEMLPSLSYMCLSEASGMIACVKVGELGSLWQAVMSHALQALADLRSLISTLSLSRAYTPIYDKGCAIAANQSHSAEVTDRGPCSLHLLSFYVLRP